MTGRASPTERPLASPLGRVGGAVALVVLALLAAQVLGLVGGPDRSSELGEAACSSAFGPEWSYEGYIETYPPSLRCSGPDGQTGLAPMPPAMRDELGIVVAPANATAV